MLLPSLLPCDAINPVVPARASILPSYQQSSTSRDILSSCRALQSILGSGGSAVNLKVVSQRPRLVRTAAQSQYNSHQKDSATKVIKRNSTSPVVPQFKRRKEEPRKQNDYQRERSLSTASTLATTSPEMKGQDLLPSPLLDQENLDLDDFPLPPQQCQPLAQLDYLSNPTSKTESPCTTPKRGRLAPLEMPLGLSASDFETLHMPPGYGPNHTSSRPQTSSSATSTSTEVLMQDEWTPADDLALVSLLLDKFRLSKRDWNECARLLGKDRDSLSRRWRMLVGSGEVGLRRGGRGGRGGRRGLEDGLFEI